MPHPENFPLFLRQLVYQVHDDLQFVLQVSLFHVIRPLVFQRPGSIAVPFPVAGGAHPVKAQIAGHCGGISLEVFDPGKVFPHIPKLHKDVLNRIFCICLAVEQPVSRAVQMTMPGQERILKSLGIKHF